MEWTERQQLPQGQQLPSVLDGRGILRYSDDPWGSTRDSFLIDPSGNLYHWDGRGTGHGQAIIAIVNNGKNIQDLPPETQTDFLYDTGLMTAIDYSEQGWVFGVKDRSDLHFMAYLGFVNPQRETAIEVLRALPDIEVVHVEEYGAGGEEVPYEDAFSYFGGMKAVASIVFLGYGVDVSTEPIDDESQRCVFDDETGYFWRYESYEHSDVLHALYKKGLLTDDSFLGWGYLLDQEHLQLYGDKDDAIQRIAEIVLDKYPQVEVLEYNGEEFYSDDYEGEQQPAEEHLRTAILRISDLYSDPVCFWCKKDIEVVGNLQLDYFLEESPDQAIPACGRCVSKREGRSPAAFFEYLFR